MRYLLDVNVLVAWGWGDHVDHERTAAWIGRQKRARAGRLLTSSIPQLGFVRVSVQRAAGRVTVDRAANVLCGMLRSLAGRHQFLTDDRAPSDGFAEWCRSAARTTDAHLLALADAHGARLATLDAGIPGAFVLPKGGDSK